ncbi:MAG: response regulator transcription factor [Magnetococcales bacterium]|nr:response regulator transcription factor [Magnetococcales bacterium]
MYRVYLTDDHAMLRQGIKSLLQRDPELVVTGESGSARETMRELAAGPFDLLVLDLSLPDMDGIRLLQQVRAKHPRLAILVLTLHADTALAARVLKLGAAGYATKDQDPAHIIDAMRRVARGGRYLAPELAAELADRIAVQAESPLHERLSDREYAVFLKLAEGLPVARIAEELYISASTVRTHRAHIFEKMGFSNNAQIVRHAVVHHLLLSKPVLN